MAECSLSYAKIVQTNAMRTCYQMAECSLSYAKIVQTNAMRTCYQMAECSLSYAKIMFFQHNMALEKRKNSKK